MEFLEWEGEGALLGTLSADMTLGGEMKKGRSIREKDFMTILI